MMKKLLLPIFFLVYTCGVSQDTNIVIEKLKLVNSTSDELMPVFTYDGKTMYFARGFHPENEGGAQAGQDIWFAELQPDSSWGKPKRFDEPLNNVQDNSVCGVSKDGKTLFLDNVYDSKKKMHPGLSVSTQNSMGKWVTPKPIAIDDFNPKPPFLEFSFPRSHPEVLIISMENNDTTKKEDLYVAMKDGNAWKKPIHMGEVLNTSGYEIAPFLSQDGKTLYFASNGLGGEGDCDIFKSTRLDDTWINWSEPENIGKEINTTGFDAYYTIDAFGRQYFVSGNLEDGDDNIYMITYEVMPVETLDTTINTSIPPLDTIVAVKDSVPVVLPPFNERYTVYFDYDKSNVDEKDQNDLTKVLTALKVDAKRKVSVTGHTCDKGGSGYNQKLSERRTQAVLDYLISNGIDKTRIASASKGLFQPKVTNDSDQNRALNRRAEIVVFE